MDATLLPPTYGNELCLALKGGIQPLTGIRLYFRTGDGEQVEDVQGYSGLPRQWQNAVQAVTGWLEGFTHPDGQSTLEILTDPATGYTELRVVFGQGLLGGIPNVTPELVDLILPTLSAALDEEVAMV